LTPELQFSISLRHIVFEMWIYLQYFYNIHRSIMRYVFHMEMTDFIFLALLWQRG